METKILVIEDEEPIQTLVQYNLESDGFKVFLTDDGEEALAMAEAHQPDLILLDWMLPNMSGIEILRQLRRDPNMRNIPVIMVSARGEEEDRVRGLDVGADDYIVKPFSPSELIARIKAVLRRIRPALTEKTLTYADVKIDVDSHRVTRGGKELHLGPTEFRLLHYLMEHAGRVFSREQLLNTIWGQDIYVELRTVDVHIRRLRKALNYNDDLPDLIRTVRSAGYALELPDDAKSPAA